LTSQGGSGGDKAVGMILGGIGGTATASQTGKVSSKGACALSASQPQAHA